MKAWVNGIGWATPAGLGMGREQIEEPLCSGVLEIPTRKQVFENADLRFGRLDKFSRIGLAALAYCLRDAEQEHWQEKRPIGIVAASRYGCLQTDLDYLQTMLPEQGKLASPNLFAYTLPNSFLGEAALRFGLTGNTLVLNQNDPSRLAALKFGLEELNWSEQQGVLAGVCDLGMPELETAGQPSPGALFLLLQKTEADWGSYGSLELSADRLLFSGLETENLESLLTAAAGK